MVDENRIEGTARQMGGKVEEAGGGLMGDTGTKAQGGADQMVGAAQEAFGSAKEAVGDWSKTIVDFTKDKPIAALLIAASAGFVMRVFTHTNRS